MDNFGVREKNRIQKLHARNTRKCIDYCLESVTLFLHGRQLAIAPVDQNILGVVKRHWEDI
jgi:hypothetical protein